MLWGGATLAVSVIAAVTATLWPDTAGPTPPGPVSTVSMNRQACLLSDHGQPATTTVFADLQRAAAGRGHVNVQQLLLPAQATDAAPEIAGLIQRKCAVIIALGPISTMGARAAATNAQSGGPRLIAITDSALSGHNLTTLPLTGLTADQITSSLDQALS